jgi:hypothetical protein
MELIFALLFFALLVAWIRVSLVLFGIYTTGVEIVFSVRYKAMQRHKTSIMRRQYRFHLFMLWTIEFVTSFGTLIAGTLWLRS